MHLKAILLSGETKYNLIRETIHSNSFRGINPYFNLGNQVVADSADERGDGGRVDFRLKNRSRFCQISVAFTSVVEANERKILFDTGNEGDVLLSNLVSTKLKILEQCCKLMD